MRGRDNVESWLDNFNADPSRLKILQPKAYEPGQYVEIGAENLYLLGFRVYEDAFHPGSTETSLTSWGRSFKGMIEAGKLPQWSWRKRGNLVFYRLELNNVVPMHQTTSTAVAVSSPRQQAQ
jgi:hypothetical protein